METLEKVNKFKTIEPKNFDISEIYEQVFPIVAKYIRSKGGVFENAKDIFHDALVIFIEKKTDNPDYIIQSNKAYILGVSKHLWMRQYQKVSHNILLNSINNEVDIPDDYFPKTNDKVLLDFLKIAGKRCLDLLRSFYFQQVPIKEIATELGYSNEHSVSVQKYKCLEKVRKTVKEKCLTYDDFTG